MWGKHVQKYNYIIITLWRTASIKTDLFGWASERASKWRKQREKSQDRGGPIKNLAANNVQPAHELPVQCDASHFYVLRTVQLSLDSVWPNVYRVWLFFKCAQKTHVTYQMPMREVWHRENSLGFVSGKIVFDNRTVCLLNFLSEINACCKCSLLGRFLSLFKIHLFLFKFRFLRTVHSSEESKNSLRKLR